MGFIGRLFGADRMGFAQNAALAECLRRTADSSMMDRIWSTMPDTLMSGAGGRVEPAWVAKAWLSCGPLAHMNLFAMTAMRVGIEEVLPGEPWREFVRNPLEPRFADETAWSQADAAAHMLSSRHRLPLQLFQVSREPAPDVIRVLRGVEDGSLAPQPPIYFSFPEPEDEPR